MIVGNSVALATFDERAETLSSRDRDGEHNPAEEFALTARRSGLFLSVPLRRRRVSDLLQFITPQYGDPHGQLSHGRAISRRRRATPTFHILSGMTHGNPRGIYFSQAARAGHQHPLDTLQTGSGTAATMRCFMIEALRRLASPSASCPRYIFIPATAHTACRWRLDHAWCRSICQARAGSNSIDQRHRRHP